jgi:hypothetical protein
MTKIQQYIMSNSEIIRIVKAELKENLIFRQIYYHNTSPNQTTLLRKKLLERANLGHGSL